MTQRLNSYIGYALSRNPNVLDTSAFINRLVENINIMSNSSDHTAKSVSATLTRTFTSNKGNRHSYDCDLEYGIVIDVLKAFDISQKYVDEFNSMRWILPYTRIGWGLNHKKFKIIHQPQALFLLFYRDGINPFLLRTFVQDDLKPKTLDEFDSLADHTVVFDRMLKTGFKKFGGPVLLTRFYGKKRLYGEFSKFRSEVGKLSPVDVLPSQMPVIQDKILRSMENGASEEMAIAFALLSNGRGRITQDENTILLGNPSDLGWSIESIVQEMIDNPKPKFNYGHILACVESGIHRDEFHKLLTCGKGGDSGSRTFQRNARIIAEHGITVDEFVATPQSWFDSWNS